MERLISIGVIVVGMYALGAYLKHCSNGAAPDPEFCTKWRTYYENFCTEYPAQCSEKSAEKHAKCVQGWDLR